MNILIVGCGKLGSKLANSLSASGHDIAIVDYDKERLNSLDDAFDGLIVKGNPIDIQVLRTAGIEGCDSVILVTEQDNTNIMSAQIAQNVFHVKNIVARVNDPVSARVFEDLGINTICPTVLAYEAITASVFGHQYSEKLMHYGSSSIEFTTLHYDKSMKGKYLSDLARFSNHVLFATQNSQNILTLFTKDNNREINESDRLIYTTIVD